MRFVPLILRPLLRRRLRQAERALARPVRAQEEELRRLVRRAARTEWGREHGYDRIRSAADFRAAVPIQRYEDLAPLWHRAFEGARDVTWPGHTPYFSVTSGTTLGASKEMPVTREALRMNRRTALTLLARMEQAAPGANLLSGQILYFGGCTELSRRGACQVGDASGINARELPRIARKYRLPEPDVAGMADWEAKVRAIVDRYRNRPVTAVVGLPSWTLILFSRLVEAAGAKTVAEVWPDLRAVVHFGMDFAPYRRQFERIAGRDLLCLDTYSSSEGGLNAIQRRKDDPAMAMELDAGVFFEFVPFDRREEPDPPRLTVGDVEPGRPYSILLSTVAGIWAYEVGDVVRFTSVEPPEILFASRTDHQLNLFGEHVIEEHLERAMAAACEAGDARIADYTVFAHPPGDGEPRGAHEWLVEFRESPRDRPVFAARLDEELCLASEDYKSHRIGDFGLRPPRITELTPGTFFRWLEEEGKLGGQHKVPRICRTPAMRERLLRISGVDPSMR